MPKAMVHPRLKRILSETSTASPSPDRQSDGGKLDLESEDQDLESEEKDIDSVAGRAPDVPVRSQSSMDISDHEMDNKKTTARTVDSIRHNSGPSRRHHDSDDIGAAHEGETSPASASQSTPKAIRISKSAPALSPTSHATPVPPSTSASSNRSPPVQTQPRLKIKLKLGGRSQESAKPNTRRQGRGKGKGDMASMFPLPARSHPGISKASSRVSAESEEADDADAESEEDMPGPANVSTDEQRALFMAVDLRLRDIPADAVESEGDVEMPDRDEHETKPGLRARPITRQSVLPNMIGEHASRDTSTSSRKKILASEEMAPRRKEMTRKRKNKSDKKSVDGGPETISRLLEFYSPWEASPSQPQDAQISTVDPRSHDIQADDIETEGDVDIPDDDDDDGTETRPGSRARLTARQAVLASMVGAEHVELETPTSSRKKTLTSEEIALRREETARKRKNMSEKKLEDEKTETINRLLKKQSSRSRAKRFALNSVVPTPQSHSADEGESGGDPPVSVPNMPGPAWRWISNRAGLQLVVPPDVSLPPEPLRPTSPAVCDIAGCGAIRKYRLVRDFQRGACGMEHLRILNEAQAKG